MRIIVVGTRDRGSTGSRIQGCRGQDPLPTHQEQDHHAPRREERAAVRRPRRTHWSRNSFVSLPLILALNTDDGACAVIDPQLTRGDRLVGQVLGSKGSLPSIYTEIEINYFLLRRLLGVKTDDKKQTKVRPPFRLRLFRSGTDVVLIFLSPGPKVDEYVLPFTLPSPCVVLPP
jgi:hypothetical protein